MRRGIRSFRVLILALVAPLIQAQGPLRFSWVNIEQDKATMLIVRRALHDSSITAIREVGVAGGYALVATTSREDKTATPDYDRWSIFSVSLATGNKKILVSGYGVRILAWVGPGQEELAISYFDCWECEAATLFTTVHFTPDTGWKVRWKGDKQAATYPHPGAIVRMTDAGEPYDDNECEQVFSVVEQPHGGFAAGYWLHSHNPRTGKNEEDVTRYSIDPASGKDIIENLRGSEAVNWERRICSESPVVRNIAWGQDSKACQRALQRPQTK